MDVDNRRELYQQVILEHNRKPRNNRKMDHPTHTAEGYNPLCGDHLTLYLQLDADNVITDISFEGDGCAISRASASLMTGAVKGLTIAQAGDLFEEFHKLIKGELNPDRDVHQLKKLAIFSGIWHYPSRVKCASLAWHAMRGALNKEKMISTE
jgi:nitrogen fixation NifU-like protein